MSQFTHSDIIFIINPNAGGVDPQYYQKKIHAVHPELTIAKTASIAELKTKMETWVHQFTVFIVVGGDGTVNAILPSLANQKQKLLGIIPVGSGNGFAREFHFTTKINVLVNQCLKGKSLLVDLLSINGTLGVNVSGVGFDSLVAYKFDQAPTRGFSTYVKSTLSALRSFTPIEITLHTETTSAAGQYQLVAIANTRQFGNNAYISPSSNPTDGIFEIIGVKPFPWYYYPKFVMDLFTKKIRPNKYIEFLSFSKKLILKSSFPHLHIDGEPHTLNGTVIFENTGDKIYVIDMN